MQRLHSPSQSISNPTQFASQAAELFGEQAQDKWIVSQVAPLQSKNQRRSFPLGTGRSPLWAAMRSSPLQMGLNFSYVLALNALCIQEVRNVMQTPLNYARSMV
jgi:hypothetical protein